MTSPAPEEAERWTTEPWDNPRLRCFAVLQLEVGRPTLPDSQHVEVFSGNGIKLVILPFRPDF
jgi:hypothetical protein